MGRKWEGKLSYFCFFSTSEYCTNLVKSAPTKCIYMCTEHVFWRLITFGVLFGIKGLILKENCHFLYFPLSDKIANFRKKSVLWPIVVLIWICAVIIPRLMWIKQHIAIFECSWGDNEQIFIMRAIIFLLFFQPLNIVLI